MVLVALIFISTLAKHEDVVISKIKNIYRLTERDIEYENVDTINIRSCVNSFRNVGFMVFNTKNCSITLDVIIDPLMSKNGSQQENFKKLYNCQKIKIRNRKEIFDPLVELEQNKVYLGPKENRFIWFNFFTQDLHPGTYKSKITFINNKTSVVYKEIPLILQVVPIYLPKENPLSVNLWSYLDASTIDENKKQAVDDLHNHGANVFVLPYYLLPKYGFTKTHKMASGFEKLDNTFALFKCYGKYLIWLGLEFPDIRESNSVKFMSSEWKSEFRTWLTDIISYLLRKLGSFDNFAIYPIDEGNHGTISLLESVTPLIKQTNPNVLIYFNPGEKLTIAEIKRIAPYVDIWQPHISLIQKSNIRAFLKNTNKPIWTYSCAVSVRAFSPYAYYRLLPWRTWYYDLNGCGFWTYSVPEKDVWNDSDGRWGDNCVIYNRANGIIGSRRWETFAEGINDSKLLFIAREKIDEDILTALVKKVVEHPNNESFANEVRQEIISLILAKSK